MLIPRAAAGLSLSQLSQIINPCGQPNSIAPNENISCDNALPHIQSAIQQFGLTSPEAQAMYLSTMAFESGKLTYVRNHYPGRPGQGTYSMMMPNNLFLFVKDNSNLFSGTQVAGLVTGSYDDSNDSSKSALLNTLVDPEYAFLPGAWWITKGAALANGCSIDMNSSPSIDQASSFMSQCIGVDPQGERIQAYSAALAALKSQ
jgi:hypothetical protein